MTRRGEAEAKQEKRWKAWRSFKRDQRGLCGVSWLSRKVLVIVLFFFIVGYVPSRPSYPALIRQAWTYPLLYHSSGAHFQVLRANALHRRQFDHFLQSDAYQFYLYGQSQPARLVGLSALS